MTSEFFRRGKAIKKDENKDVVFIPNTKYFREDVQKYANGLINANGGVLFFGIKENGVVDGVYVSRKHEDEFRLTIDRVIGSFQPFYAPCNYRVIFHPIQSSMSSKVIEIKISAGAPGQIYEDGREKIFLFSKNEILGPLWPQEIKKLVIQRFQENLDSLKGLENFTTPAVQRTSKVTLEKSSK